jgi:hypothetical protein
MSDIVSASTKPLTNSISSQGQSSSKKGLISSINMDEYEDVDRGEFNEVQSSVVIEDDPMNYLQVQAVVNKEINPHIIKKFTIGGTNSGDIRQLLAKFPKNNQKFFAHVLKKKKPISRYQIVLALVTVASEVMTLMFYRTYHYNNMPVIIST